MKIGFSALRPLALLLAASTVSGCIYGFSSGTGLTGVQSMAIIPCENETTRLELTAELYDIMFRRLPNQLGLVIAGEGDADVIVRCVISGYSLEAPNYRAGATSGDAPEVLQREVRIRAGVQIIDPREELILWEDMAVQAEGQYLEASETEEIGKVQALDLLVQRMIDGAQSNW